MSIFKSYLGLTLLILICFTVVKANKDSDSDSDSDESGGDGKIKNRIISSSSPQIVQPQAYPYNHPAYMPPVPPTAYGAYNYPHMPYYSGYAQPPQQVPLQGVLGPYPYGGYYNQPAAATQGVQYYPGIPSGSSTINHSLKVNKEYAEDGHHFKPDGSSAE